MATLNFDLDFKRGREKGESQKKKKKWADKKRKYRKRRKVNIVIDDHPALGPDAVGPVHGLRGRPRPRRLISPHGRSEGSLIRLYLNYLEHLVRVPLPPPS